MALLATVQTQFGFNQSDAYIKINSFNGNRDEVTFEVVIYASEEARNDNKQYLERKFFTVPYTDGMAISSLYNYLKDAHEFINPVDV